MPDLVFDHYTMRVKNLDRSATFYKKVVGLKEIYNKTEKEYIRWFSLGNGELHIAEKPDEVVETHVGIHIALSVADLDAFMNKLRDNDIVIHNSKGTPNQITNRADGVRQIIFKDPDNYWIEVNEAK
ncbi:MAG: VOC family protein [Balneolaceae bacterium]|nr:VOC family protein [Balneolaceae bacterium]